MDQTRLKMLSVYNLNRIFHRWNLFVCCATHQLPFDGLQNRIEYYNYYCKTFKYHECYFLIFIFVIHQSVSIGRFSNSCVLLFWPDSKSVCIRIGSAMKTAEGCGYKYVTLICYGFSLFVFLEGSGIRKVLRRSRKSVEFHSKTMRTLHSLKRRSA